MNKTILAAAILAMAAFAGVMVVGDDTDAATFTQVVYKIDNSNVKAVAISGSEFVVLSPEELGLTYSGTFNYWKNGSDGVFIPGQTYSTADATGGTLNLTAEIIRPTTVSFIVDDASTPVTPSDGKVAVPSTISTEKDGYDFKGWKYSKTGAVLSNAAVGELSGVVAGETFTAVFEKIYKVSWVAGGVTLAEGTSINLNKPANDPAKENFTFAGWVDAAGIMYTVDNAITADVDEAYKFVADTVFSAKFIPDNMTVTFQVGEFTSTQTVLYGEKAMKPELPAGYIAWMLGEKEFDFNTPITENITIVALEGEPTTIYAVTFEIEGQTPVKLDSENYKKSIPDTAREGYAFQGWVVKGASQYVDPMTYEITGDITFVAVYKEVAPPEPEQPKFYQTPLGQCAIILAVFVVGLVFYGIFTGRINVPKFKISRVEKTEEPAVEQVEEEKKP